MNRALSRTNAQLGWVAQVHPQFPGRRKLMAQRDDVPPGLLNLAGGQSQPPVAFQRVVRVSQAAGN